MKIALYFSAGLLALLAACSNQPTATEPQSTTPAPAAATTPQPAGTAFAVQGGASTLYWKGEKPTGFHEGSVGIKEGKIFVDQGNITGGSIVVDMNSIICSDLKSPGDNADLVDHLKSPDFFDVATNPVATFEISSITPLVGAKDATHTINGNLTLRGKTNPVSFPATVVINGSTLTATSGKFTIDRTKWGITFKSATLASVVKDKAISDNITLQISLKAGA